MQRFQVRLVTSSTFKPVLIMAEKEEKIEEERFVIFLKSVGKR